MIRLDILFVVFQDQKETDQSSVRITGAGMSTAVATKHSAMASFRGLAPIVLATPAPISHRTAEENLGLGYIAAVLRNREATVLIVDGWLEGLTSQQIVDRICYAGPVLWVGLSCYRSNIQRAIEIVELLRNCDRDFPIVAGGYGPTFYAKEFLSAGFDIAVRGEAEETVCQLSEHFAFGSPCIENILGISYIQGNRVFENAARPLAPILDQLPFPSRDTFPATITRKSAVHIDSSRGCAAHCIFCSIVAFARTSPGHQWRQRSIIHFVDELDELHSRGATCFKVIDDSFIEPPRDEDWCRALADEILRRKLAVRLRGSIRADRVNQEIVVQLKRAGFFAFSCGIESFSDSALRRMAKTATAADNLRALAIFKQHGIYVQAGHILFDQGTTMHELWENYYEMRRHAWTVSKGIFTEMYAAQGTPFTHLLKKRGNLLTDNNNVGNHSYLIGDPSVQKAHQGLKQWHKSHILIYDKTVDAISAPKALTSAELKRFHFLATQLRERDLDFMHALLIEIESGATQISEFAKQEIERSEAWYTMFAREVSAAYADANLVYDAEENPFV